MDIVAGTIAVIMLLLLIGTGVVLIVLDARGEGLAPLQDRLRPLGDALARVRAYRLPVRPLPSSGVATRRAVSASRVSPSGEIVPIRPDAPVAPAQWQEELRSALSEQGERLERRTDERTEEIARRYEKLARETQSRQDAHLDRLRTDLTSAIAVGAGRRATDRMDERASDVLAELYARLARLEAALAAVTHPMLLPGEPYRPPPELLPESLVWDNWKDVGERSFALADHFNAHRLTLPASLAGEIATFITTLRGELTGAIYPNLQPDPSAAERHTLQEALGHLATDLPRVRDRLETAYRTRGSAAPIAGTASATSLDV